MSLFQQQQLATWHHVLCETEAHSCVLQGMRSAPSYVVNGVCMFLFWFVGRIMLFMWFFHHMWQHESQIRDLQPNVQLLMATVPPLLFILNIFWFGKIVKGLIKLLQGQLGKVIVQPTIANCLQRPAFWFLRTTSVYLLLLIKQAADVAEGLTDSVTDFIAACSLMTRHLIWSACSTQTASRSDVRQPTSSSQKVCSVCL